MLRLDFEKPKNLNTNPVIPILMHLILVLMERLDISSAQVYLMIIRHIHITMRYTIDKLLKVPSMGFGPIH